MSNTNDAPETRGETEQPPQLRPVICEGHTAEMVLDLLERQKKSPSEVTPHDIVVASGRGDIVELMLARGYDKDALNDEGCTLLQSAALMGHLSVVETLLGNGADCSLRCRLGDMAALDQAAANGNLDIVKLLIDHGADVNAAGGLDGNTPLIRAAISGEAEIISLLCLKGAHADTQNARGLTPLILAVTLGHAAATQALLAAGANVSFRGYSDGTSALDLASSCEELFGILRAIIEHGADVNDTGTTGNIALHYATAAGNVDAIQLLCLHGADVDKLDDQGRSPLNIAAAKSNPLATTRALLVAGADVNVRRGVDQISALDMAALAGRVDVARALISHGADVNAPGAGGSTALHTAANGDSAEVVALLCLEGADVDKLDDQPCTPLQLAASRGHASAARALLAGGADATLRGDGGFAMSALDYAAHGGHVDIVVAILETGANVNAGGGRLTALHFAALSIPGNGAAIDALIGAGANVEAEVESEGSNGYTPLTPLSLAAGSGNVPTTFSLLKHGANLHSRNERGETPLHHAASSAGNLGTAEVVDLLLRRGADENISSKLGSTAEDAVGCRVQEQDRVGEEFERVRILLANAPADRAWRRRGFLVMCRAHHPGGRVKLRQENASNDGGIAKITRRHAKLLGAEANWAGVVRMLMGAGVDPISLMGDGANIIFEKIVGYV